MDALVLTTVARKSSVERTTNHQRSTLPPAVTGDSAHGAADRVDEDQFTEKSGCAAGGRQERFPVVLIRRETLSDEPAIFRVHNAAFATDNGRTAPEAVLVDQLRAASDSIPALSLVAEISDTVVGHVLGSRAHIDEYSSLGIGPLGVLPTHQQQGVGTALMHAVLAAADALDLSEAVLLGDPAFYHRSGFQLARPLGVLPSNPGWAEHFQIRTLTSWTNQRQGAFRYAPAFDNA
jgi:putative acetyltransferase